jgi:hypothetical protein
MLCMICLCYQHFSSNVVSTLATGPTFGLWLVASIVCFPLSIPFCNGGAVADIHRLLIARAV